MDDLQNNKFGGLHIHFNLIDKKGQNVFINQRCKTFLYVIGGLLKFINNSMKYFAPNPHSLLRLRNSDFFTPTTISWGNNNRTTALRIPGSQPINRRIEHRAPSNHADLAKILCAILLAAGYGLKNKFFPNSPQIFGNAFDSQYNLPKIPNSLREINNITPIDHIINWETFEAFR